MSPAETWGLVLTGIPIALAVGGLILRAVVSHWTTPLREGVSDLKNVIATLTELLREEAETRAAGQTELHRILEKQGEILDKLEGIVADHETRITVIEKTTGVDGVKRRRA